MRETKRDRLLLLSFPFEISIGETLISAGRPSSKTQTGITDFNTAYRHTPPLGPLSTAAVEHHRVETRRRSDEQPMFSSSTEAQIRYSLRHKNLAH